MRTIVDAIAEASGRIANLVALGKFARGMERDHLIELDAGAMSRRRAEQVLIEALRGRGVREIVSAGRDTIIPLDEGAPYAVAIDALDGASNIDTNMPLGTIFSISFAGEASAVRSGTMQLAAGFVVYGPQTNLVLTLGSGTDIFILDRETSRYRLAKAKVQVPVASTDYAIDASNYRHWPSAVRSLIDDHLDETGAPGAQTFNMRWIGSLVAEAYRILIRGGVFLCPPDKRHLCEKGCQRLLTAAHPIAFVMEQAGGEASSGYQRILESATAHLGERTPFIFGSRDVVDRIERLHTLPDSLADMSPLFGSRGLFRV